MLFKGIGNTGRCSAICCKGDRLLLLVCVPVQRSSSENGSTLTRASFEKECNTFDRYVALESFTHPLPSPSYVLVPKLDVLSSMLCLRHGF